MFPNDRKQEGKIKDMHAGHKDGGLTIDITS